MKEDYLTCTINGQHCFRYLKMKSSITSEVICPLQR